MYLLEQSGMTMRFRQLSQRRGRRVCCLEPLFFPFMFVTDVGDFKLQIFTFSFLVGCLEQDFWFLQPRTQLVLRQTGFLWQLLSEELLAPGRWVAALQQAEKRRRGVKGAPPRGRLQCLCYTVSASLGPS